MTERSQEKSVILDSVFQWSSSFKFSHNDINSITPADHKNYVDVLPVLFFINKLTTEAEIV